jgi:hypothetical protein
VPHRTRTHPGLSRLAAAAICLLAMCFAPLVHAWSHPTNPADASHEQRSACGAHGCGSFDHEDPQPVDPPVDNPSEPRQPHACDVCVALHMPAGSGLDLSVPTFVHRATEPAVLRAVMSSPTITSGPVLFTCGPPMLG